MVQIYFVEGIIGAGKTTFCEYLTKNLNEDNIKTLFVKEPVDKWESMGILKEFYSDMKANSYKFQSYAFITRFNSLLNIKDIENYDVVLVERSVFSDRYFFAQNLYETNLMTKVEYEMYLELWQLCYKILPTIMKDFKFIYWRPSLEISCNRVKSRNRNGESVPFDYQQDLIKMHDNFFHIVQDLPKFTQDINSIQEMNNVQELNPVQELNVKFTNLNITLGFEKPDFVESNFEESDSTKVIVIECDKYDINEKDLYKYCYHIFQ